MGNWSKKVKEVYILILTFGLLSNQSSIWTMCYSTLNVSLRYINMQLLKILLFVIMILYDCVGSIEIICGI